VVHVAEGWHGPGAALSFEVRGVPAPQGSKRYFGASESGKTRVAESSARVKPWRTDVRAAAERALDDRYPWQGMENPPRDRLWTEPVLVEMLFYLPRPMAHYRTGRNADVLRDTAPRYPAGTTNDLDKLIRAVLDALTGMVWSDDGHVVGLYVTKLYSHQGKPPGVSVHIKEG
jgi:hypothetical protein